MLHAAREHTLPQPSKERCQTDRDRLDAVLGGNVDARVC